MVDYLNSLKSKKSELSLGSKGRAQGCLSKDLLATLENISPYCSRERCVRVVDNSAEKPVISQFNYEVAEQSLESFLKQESHLMRIKAPKALEEHLKQNCFDFQEEDYWTLQNGKSGWKCAKCSNFNYENRRKCNVCQKKKSDKILGEKKKDILEYYTTVVGS